MYMSHTHHVDIEPVSEKVHKHACICTHQYILYVHLHTSNVHISLLLQIWLEGQLIPLPHTHIVTSQAYRNPLSLHTLTHMYMYRHTQSTTSRIHSHFPLSLPLSHSLPLLLCRSLPCFLTSAIATLPLPSPTLKSALKCTRSL